MPITTNPNFDAANLKQAKRPIYLVNIEGAIEGLTTYRAEDFVVIVSGYGMNGYGLSGYGY